ncbi:SDR family oxidoreductase [Aureispira anguillae]|uniref:Peroxisomal trans-2-enoyl-CoA reductase n=1 Tax=Aureispira anguillae TaxID=2864201 RepID=A0A915YCN8_9BACT|nr:SDR family oxidoreductase [Aureispira anguillae]BDS10642.1 SDR family oxidoreductase [Aureispira anguillae]
MFIKDLLKDKVILVTGGRSGIGYQIARSCLLYGAVVYITSRKEEKLKAAAKKLKELGPCYAIAGDIRAVEQVQNVAEHIKALSGRLDILVNNAGGQFPAPAQDISPNGWNAVINNNLNGTWYMTQIMAKEFFIPQQSGSIINIIANMFRGFPGMVHTGAARAGVDNITKTLAVEWSRFNIRINAIAPGIIQSTGLEQYPPELLKDVSDRIPLKRLGTTKEVADLAVFLMSPMANFITGETIYIDGGQRLWGDVFEF